MKKIFAITCTLLCISLSTPASSDDTTHRAAAEQLLITMEVPKMLDQVRPIMDQALEMAYNSKNPPAEAREILDKYSSKLADAMAEELSWESLKDLYIEIYIGAFTETELNEITKLFSTPAGKKFASRSSELMQTASVQMQPRMVGMQNRVSKIIEQMVVEIGTLQN